MTGLTIGVLGAQGDIGEHVSATTKALSSMELKGDVVAAWSSSEIAVLDGVILPGGESTAIGRLTEYMNAVTALRERIGDGMPVLGTCAGLVMLAKEVSASNLGNSHQPRIGTMDIEVQRNAFGGQKDSFETDLSIRAIGENPFRGIFIRSPVVKRIGEGVIVLGSIGDSTVAVQEGNMIGTSFHPELTQDTRFHELFLDQVRKLAE